jgi:hypothetical protein
MEAATMATCFREIWKYELIDPLKEVVGAVIEDWGGPLGIENPSWTRPRCRLVDDAVHFDR